MGGSWSRLRVLPSILAFAAAVRIGYLAAGWDDPRLAILVHDAARYHEWAQVLAAGGSFEEGPYHQAPLYPLLLSVLYRVAGPSPKAAFVLQAALGVATIALVWRVGRRAYGERAGGFAAAAAALFGPAVFHESTLMPTALGAFLTMLAVDRFQEADRTGRAPPILGTGLAAGLAALTTSGAFLFLLAGAAWLAWPSSPGRRARAARIALCLGGAATVLAPVAIRNRLVGGEWALLATNGGITFAHGNHPEAVGVYTLLPGFSGAIGTQRPESRALAERAEGSALTDGEVSRYWFGHGLRFAADRPGRWLLLEFRKLALALADREQPLESDPSLDPNPARWLLPIPFALLPALAVAGRFASPARTRAGTPVVLAVLCALAVMLVFYVSSRYRIPMVPPLAVLAGAGLAALLEGSGRRRLGASAVAVLVATISLAWVPVFASELERAQRGQGWSERGRLLVRAGRASEGIAALRRGVDLDPGSAYGWIDLAAALAEQGEPSGAEEALREAARLAPALPEPRFRLGVLLYRAGRFGEAADEFLAAYRLAPTDAASANNLLGTLIGLGRLQEARAVRDEMAAGGVPVDEALERRLR